MKTVSKATRQEARARQRRAGIRVRQIERDKHRAALWRLRKAQTPAPIYVTGVNLYSLGRMPWSQTIRAFKVSTAQGRGPHHGGGIPQLICEPEAMLRVPEADTSWTRDCGAGVNVATFKWCIDAFGNMYDTRAGRPLKGLGHYKMWIVEFQQRDLACIPRDSLGKFRLTQCRVIKQVMSMRDVPKECR